MYKWVAIGGAQRFEQLDGLVDAAFQPKKIAQKLNDGLSDAVKGVLVEFDYVDKDYRSTFYGYYAKKGRRYRTDCVRLHFFDERVSFDEKLPTLRCEGDRQLSDHYFGYVVLRPTLVSTVGRSLLSPNIRRGARGRSISGEHTVHLLGYKLTVRGFPSMDQHSDIAVCAHVACWSVLRHYSQRYPQHAEVLLQQVTRMAHHFDPGGLVPSHGLAMDEAERVFHAAGTYPLVVPKGQGPSGSSLFYSQLMAYLESGFPLFTGMVTTHPKTNTPQGHAVVVIGRAWDEPGIVSAAHDASPSGSTASPQAPAYRAWQLLSEFVVVDDNRLPYLQIASPGKSPAAGDEYTANDFNRFIVALPEKIYYPATAVEAQAVLMFGLLPRMRPVGIAMPDAADTVVRYFITTLSRFREEIRESMSQFDGRLIDVIMNLQAAQFIWVIEYSSLSQWRSGHITARVVLDATASLRDPAPAWLAHSVSAAIVFDRLSDDGRDTTVIPMRSSSSPLTRMELNLRAIHAQ